MSLRYFKCYEATEMIPLFFQETFTGLLGENGVGKSAVLEALATFFNERDWIRNKTRKKGEKACGVAPIISIPLGELANHFNLTEIKFLEEFSKKIAKNLEGKVEIDFLKEDILLSCMYFESGNVKLFDGLSVTGPESEKDDPIAIRIRELMRASLKFIYIDAEIDIDGNSSLNSEIAEFIKGSAIVSEITTKLKSTKVKDEKGERTTLRDIINDKVLKHLDEEVIKKLKEIDPTYDYKNLKPGATSLITERRISELATEALFANRELTKRMKNKDIGLSDMSSGQRRRVFLDFILVLIKGLESEEKQKLILAIDEPEISVDASSRIQQFEKLKDISESGVSVLFTTHWYGWIAQLIKGGTILIKEQEEQRTLLFKSIEEFFDPPHNQDVPYEMRTMFDFLSSLGTWADNDTSKIFVICEGKTDRYYISKHFPDIKIIPLRGQGEVDRFYTIFSSYYVSSKKIPKNVFFLIDTDLDRELPESSTGNNLRRISRKTTGEIEIVWKGENKGNKCTIEDLLPGSAFLRALKKASNLLRKDEKDFIQKMKIKHATETGIDAFGLDAVGVRDFKKIFKGDFKLETARAYDPTDAEKAVFQALLKFEAQPLT